jgi:hypothetical protein
MRRSSELDTKMWKEADQGDTPIGRFIGHMLQKSGVCML